MLETKDFTEELIELCHGKYLKGRGGWGNFVLLKYWVYIRTNINIFMCVIIMISYTDLKHHFTHQNQDQASA